MSAQSLDQANTVHYRHVQVGDDQTQVDRLREFGQGVLPVFGLDYVIAVAESSTVRIVLPMLDLVVPLQKNSILSSGIAAASNRRSPGAPRAHLLRTGATASRLEGTTIVPQARSLNVGVPRDALHLDANRPRVADLAGRPRECGVRVFQLGGFERAQRLKHMFDRLNQQRTQVLPRLFSGDSVMASRAHPSAMADRIFNIGFAHGEGLSNSFILNIHQHLRSFAIA